MKDRFVIDRFGGTPGGAGGTLVKTKPANATGFVAVLYNSSQSGPDEFVAIHSLNIRWPSGDASVAACRGWVTSRVIHQNTILGKHVTDDAVILEMEYDVTPHATKQRQQWREAAVYRVSGGKITDVRFYYKPPVAA